MAKRICVTGAAGKAGRVTVAELLAHDYQVLATDRVRPSPGPGTDVLLADLTDYGQVTEVLRDVDAVVHLANIPAPGIHTPAVTFNANMTMNFNVFHAAAEARLDRPSAALLAEVFPGVTLTRDVAEFGTLLAIDRARDALGFAPQHSWRDHLAARSS
jgi:UDP-glucose 4-epimerase